MGLSGVGAGYSLMDAVTRLFASQQLEIVPMTTRVHPARTETMVSPSLSIQLNEQVTIELRVFAL